MLHYINSFDDFCAKLLLLIRIIYTSIEIKMDNLNFIVLSEIWPTTDWNFRLSPPLLCFSTEGILNSWRQVEKIAFLCIFIFSPSLRNPSSKIYISNKRENLWSDSPIEIQCYETNDCKIIAMITCIERK